MLGGIGIALMSLISQPWHALLLYGVVFAIGNGAASLVIVGVVVMRAYPGRAGLANAVAISGMSVGQLLMMAILAPVMVQVGWRHVFIWIGIAHLVLLPLMLGLPGRGGPIGPAGRRARGCRCAEAARATRVSLLLLITRSAGSTCFVTTHVVAIAQDHGLDAMFSGQLLPWASPGSRRDRGGPESDRVRPIRPTAAISSRACSCSAGSRSTSRSVDHDLRAGVRLDFLVTAPLTVVFVRENFGTKNLARSPA